MMNNMGNLLKQAKQMQEKMGEVQKELENYTTEGSSGGGMVKATVTGKGDVRKLAIDPELLKPEEVEILEDLLVAALNDAKGKAQRHAEEEMSKATGGLPMGGDFKLPF